MVNWWFVFCEQPAYWECLLFFNEFIYVKKKEHYSSNPWYISKLNLSLSLSLSPPLTHTNAQSRLESWHKESWGWFLITAPLEASQSIFLKLPKRWWSNPVTVKPHVFFIEKYFIKNECSRGPLVVSGLQRCSQLEYCLIQ